MIRLGYEEFLEDPIKPGVRIPSMWFFGRQGNRKFELYSDFVYEDIKKGLNTEHTRWYSREVGTSIFLELDAYTDRFEVGLYKDYIKESKSFLVPIRILSHYQDIDFEYLHREKLPEDLLNYIHSGKATVLFYTYWEGNVDAALYNHIQTFVENNGLRREEVWISTSSLRRDICPKYENRTYGLHEVNFFNQDFWFLKREYANKIENQEKYREDLERFNLDNLTNPKTKKFLCLNRRRMPHRTFIASFISAHPEIAANSFYSLGVGVQYLSRDGINQYTGQDALNYLGDWTWDLYKQDPEIYQELETVRKYLENRKGESVLVECDKVGDPLQLLENPTELKEDLYRKVFVNVITETYADSRGYQFITEKTVKTLYAQVPFIVLAPAGFLETLHHLGFKTFENYWDESYDSIENDWERYMRVCEIIKKLNLKNYEELFEMTKDMSPLLYHNASLTADCRDIEETLRFLENIQNR